MSLDTFQLDTFAQDTFRQDVFYGGLAGVADDPRRIFVHGRVDASLAVFARDDNTQIVFSQRDN